ncbi:sensor histidine kinase [Virgibacillus profundi]|uniref:Heme sensor protein HssS n=1 Tax=Virgibacillus profundi TaxID=2024555 RepID=A0A2A2IA40_9BACI|nr:HAMP domain-containing sensor histidine kinase [Virgibacillus profundi]PAV28196.1 sensor histidine kinase [Virgibacillus profundi]PXY52501.1 sensor histidine kinase [Virgibacillus profundi]
MRTLYVRIIVTTMAIMILSALIAFAVSNIYYQQFLKSENDKKVTHIAENIVKVFEKNNNQSISDYLTAMADLGYKFHLVNQNGEEQTYGDPFTSEQMDQASIKSVLNSEVYHGIANYPWKPFVTGFFDNELMNTIGVPIQIDGETHALFVRPNSSQQFGEMRIFLAVLLILVLLFSFVLVLISTRFIVKPIKKLTEATKKIAAGNHHLKLKVNRRDEIGRLAGDFSKMSNSLEQTEEKRQEFVSNVSHEIQSPLTSIQGFSQALREEDISKEERERYLNIIESESKRLSALSKQLLTLSNLDHEIDKNDFIPFDIADQLREVVLTMEWQWREKNIAIEMDTAPTTIVGEPKLLQQVWVNLITNAIHYSKAGEKLTIRTANEKSSVLVSIEDTGMGIAEADIPHLFDRFYKVDKARTRSENSSGLGLAIVKKIIELHGGTVMVESEFGIGSTFTITIPKK